MKTVFILLLSFFVFGILGQLTQTQKDELLSKHNALRKTVNPAAQTMPDLTWDADLETIADTWVKKCTANGNLIAHNAGRSDTYPGYVGENIYGSSGAVSNFGNAVQLWFNEYVDYTYDTNTCATNKVCGHYT